MKNLSTFWQKRIAYLHAEYVKNLHRSTVLSLSVIVLLFYSFQRFDLKHNLIMKVDSPIVIDIIPPTGGNDLPEPPRINIPIEGEESIEDPEPEDVPTIDELFTIEEEPDTPPLPKDPDDYLSVIKVTEMPKLIKKVTPEYPRLAIATGIEGTVNVLIYIGKNGRVEKAEILKSSSPLLNQSALEAARQYVFRPAKIGLRPVKVKMVIPIRYRLTR
jgi:TonB family protein